MIRVWRICAAKHAGRAFDGEGARRLGGRWNPRGVAVVYTAGHLSLATLELFVHLDPDTVPDRMVAIPADLPDDLAMERVEVAGLPRSWREYPGPEALQKLGGAWVEAGRSAVLAVPSVVVPKERNYLLNPAHPGFRRIVLGPKEPFSFDPRMWKTRP